MSLLPDDPKNRCGYRWLATDWVYKTLYRLGLTTQPVDPFEDICVVHDTLTIEGYPYKHITAERKQQFFNDAVDERNKTLKHYKQGAFYKWATGLFTRFVE